MTLYRWPATYMAQWCIVYCLYYGGSILPLSRGGLPFFGSGAFWISFHATPAVAKFLNLCLVIFPSFSHASHFPCPLHGGYIFRDLAILRNWQYRIPSWWLVTRVKPRGQAAMARPVPSWKGFGRNAGEGELLGVVMRHISSSMGRTGSLMIRDDAGGYTSMNLSSIRNG